MSIWLVAVISPVTSIPAPKFEFPAIVISPVLLIDNLVAVLVSSKISK